MNVNNYRKMIRPTDPRVNIKLPEALYQELKKSSARNARRLSDEIVARILATLKQCGISKSTNHLMQLIYESNLKYKG